MERLDSEARGFYWTFAGRLPTPNSARLHVVAENVKVTLYGKLRYGSLAR